MKTLAHKSRKGNEMTKIEFFYKETGKHIRNVQLLLNEVIRGLMLRARSHDISKFDDAEKDLFVEATPDLDRLTYGSEAYKESLRKLKPALERHYELNTHHPECFPNGIQGMCLMDLIEMLCDWKAATKRHADGDIYKSIEQNQKRFGYSDDLKQILINTMRQLESQNDLLEEHDKYIGE